MAFIYIVFYFMLEYAAIDNFKDLFKKKNTYFPEKSFQNEIFLGCYFKFCN